MIWIQQFPKYFSFYQKYIRYTPETICDLHLCIYQLLCKCQKYKKRERSKHWGYLNGAINVYNFSLYHSKTEIIRGMWRNVKVMSKVDIYWCYHADERASAHHVTHITLDLKKWEYSRILEVGTNSVLYSLSPKQLQSVFEAVALSGIIIKRLLSPLPLRGFQH